MKVYISGYRDHWISPYTVLQRVCFWRVIPRDTDEEGFEDDPWIERWAKRIKPLCKAFQWFMDRVHPPVRYIKIDRYDTWSMDSTLAHIILPMLKQLRDTQHGSCPTELEDVPEHLHPKTPPGPNNNYNDETVHERWQWVMNEMIWAFEQKIDNDDESKFFDHSTVNRSAPLNQQIKQIKVDRDALEAHQKRKDNGFRLFGKYYQGLWD